MTVDVLQERADLRAAGWRELEGDTWVDPTDAGLRLPRVYAARAQRLREAHATMLRDRGAA